MSHLVEKMFSVREMPWHYDETRGKTTILMEPPRTWDEAKGVAGLDWDPVEETPYRKVVRINAATQQPEEVYEEVPEFKWVVRSDTGYVLGSVPRAYEVITNSDLGAIAEVMMEGHDMSFETGGCLDGGRKVWILLRMGDFLEIPGDPSATARYLALLSDHGGHGAAKAIATQVRVVCANTWHAADVQTTRSSSKSGIACFSFHHRAQWRKHAARLQADVKAALSGATAEMEGYRKLAEEMSRIPVSREQEELFVQNFIFPVQKEHELTERTWPNVRNARELVRQALASPTCEGIRGTAYSLLQAGGEYADHLRPFKTNGTHLGRTVFTAEALKNRARNLAELAGQGLL